MTFSTKKLNYFRRIAALMLIIAAVAFSASVFLACGEPRGIEAARAFLPNVVRVAATSGADPNAASKYGSGIIAEKREDGSLLCLTNYHVVSDKSRVFVTGSDGTACDAEVLGYSEYHDVAVLAVSSSYACAYTDIIAENKIAAASDGKVFSLGNKNNEGVRIFEGEITEKNKIVTAGRVGGSGNKYVPVIETTADIGEGVSGGALLDDCGRLVGLCTYRDAGGYYAVPVAAALAVLDAVKSGGRGNVPLMGGGINGAGVRLLNDYGEIGVLVSGGTPATMHAAGFRGIFTLADGGLHVTAAGENCPFGVDTIITEIGGVKATADNICAVFGAFYNYSTDGAGDALIVRTKDGGAVEYTGGGIALKKK